MIADFVSTIIRAADALGAWLVIASIQVALIGLIVACVDRLLAQRAWPQLRSAAWWAVLLALVMPPFFDSPLNLWRVMDPAAGLHDLVRSSPATSASGVELPWQDSGRNDQGTSPVLTRASVFRVIASIWLVGTMILLVAAIRRAAMLRRQWLGEPPVRPDPWFLQMTQDVTKRLGMRRAPDVRIQSAATGAAVIGAWRPIVVLPERLLHDQTHERIEHVLLHEFAHVCRGDAIAARLCSFIQFVYWFHPIAWIARARLETLREICCDQTVVTALNGLSGTYRKTLLHLARSLLTSHGADARPAFVHRHSQIMARLMYLKRPLPGRPVVVRGLAMSVFFMLTLCCTPRISTTSRPADVPTDVRLADLPGCMQLRFVVMRAMANEAVRVDVH